MPNDSKDICSLYVAITLSQQNLFAATKENRKNNVRSYTVANNDLPFSCRNYEATSSTWFVSNSCSWL